MRFSIIIIMFFLFPAFPKGCLPIQEKPVNNATRSSQWKNVDEMFVYCNKNNVDLIIDKDIYINKRVQCTVNIFGEAKIIINTKFKNAGIDFVRSEQGKKINYNNKISKAQKLTFLKDQHAYFINSSQILTTRKENAPYLKNEFIVENKNASSLASYDYDNNGLNITEYQLSEKRQIKNLNVIITGNEISNDDSWAFIRNYRDNISFISLYIKNETKFKLSVAFENNTNYNTVMEKPVIDGFNKDGSGYGVANYSSRGLTITDGKIINCRHAYTGRNTFDVTIKNGYFSDGIDDHWTDNFLADSVTILAPEGAAAFQFAGNNIRIYNPTVLGKARVLFGIREDTPYLGGKIEIVEPKFNTDLSSDIYVFSMTNPNADFKNTPTQTIKMPDVLEIVTPNIKTNASKIFLVYQTEIKKKFSSYSKISLKGNITVNSSNKNVDLFGVLMIKNSNFQTNKSILETSSFNLKKIGEMNATLVYYIDNDGNNNLASDVKIDNTKGWDNIKFSENSIGYLKIANSFFKKLLLENSTSINRSKSYYFDRTAFGNYDEINIK